DSYKKQNCTRITQSLSNLVNRRAVLKLVENKIDEKLDAIKAETPKIPVEREKVSAIPEEKDAKKKDDVEVKKDPIEERPSEKPVELKLDLQFIQKQISVAKEGLAKLLKTTADKERDNIEVKIGDYYDELVEISEIYSSMMTSKQIWNNKEFC